LRGTARGGRRPALFQPAKVDSNLVPGFDTALQPAWTGNLLGREDVLN